MTRETTAAADLLPSLGPLLASLLVVLASLPAVETLRLRLSQSVRGVLGVRSSLLPQAPRGLAPQCRAPLGRRLDGPSPTLLLGATRTGFTLPLFADSALRRKTRPA